MFKAAPAPVSEPVLTISSSNRRWRMRRRSTLARENAGADVAPGFAI